jgi:ribosomal protein S17E
VACKRLALGEKHPDIERALADLRSYTGNVKETVKQLKHDYNAWLADARKLREMTKQDHAELREIMCRKGVTEADIKQKVNELADRWASQISSAYGTLLGQSDRLGERASSDKLQKRKGAKEVLEGLRANRATLEKIKTYDLHGSNNPRIKAKMEYGTNYHASWSCSGIKEFKISSDYCDNPIREDSSCRADCVTLGSTCVVIELKPDNDEAKAMGEKQMDAYQKGLRKWFDKNKDELLKTYPDVSQCVKDGQISTNTKLETYSFCPSDSEAQGFGESLDGISSDVSESD